MARTCAGDRSIFSAPFPSASNPRLPVLVSAPITINVDDSIVGGDTTANIAAAIANIGGGGVFTASATGGAAQYDNTDDNTYAGVTTGGDDGTTGAVYAGNTITVSVGIGATITDVAGVIDGLADFAATAASGEL